MTPSARKTPQRYRGAETMGKLAIMFFIAPSLVEPCGQDERRGPALRAFRRPPLPSGLLQARRAGHVRFCSQRSRQNRDLNDASDSEGKQSCLGIRFPRSLSAPDLTNA